MNEESQIICPVCDQVISDFNEGETNPCEHVMLTYVDMLNGDFVHVGAGAEKIAEDMLVKYDGDEAGYCLEELMEAYVGEHDGFVVISLTTYGMSCGPCSSTEYNLIKLN
jgi:hypothetical protein